MAIAKSAPVPPTCNKQCVKMRFETLTFLKKQTYLPSELGSELNVVGNLVEQRSSEVGRVNNEGVEGVLRGLVTERQSRRGELNITN